MGCSQAKHGFSRQPSMSKGAMWALDGLHPALSFGSGWSASPDPKKCQGGGMLGGVGPSSCTFPDSSLRTIHCVLLSPTGLGRCLSLPSRLGPWPSMVRDLPLFGAVTTGALFQISSIPIVLLGRAPCENSESDLDGRTSRE